MRVSALDASARVLYTILADEHASNKPSLYGLSLTTGVIVTAVPLRSSMATASAKAR